MATQPRYDLETVRSAAAGHWLRVLPQICGIRAGILTPTEKPCPKCGGTGRFNTYRDFEQTGGMRCNQCFSSRNGDGFAAIQWLTGCTFPEAIRLVAESLGVPPEKATPGRKGKPKGGKSDGSKGSQVDPEKDLEFVEWNEMLAAMWCQKKPPIKPHALAAVGARMTIYKKEWKVIALPIRGEKDQVVGWCMYNVTGGTLPTFDKFGKVTGQERTKNTRGSEAGVIKTGIGGA